MRAGNYMAKKMKQITLFVTAMMILNVILYRTTGNGFCLTLAITFGTTSYHFIMRLLVGFLINFLLNNQVDYQKRWFRVSAAELVHEVIIVLSFVPIFASLSFGAFPVFFVTFVLVACFDALFVVMQRYNRPRIMKLMKTSDKNVMRED